MLEKLLVGIVVAAAFAYAAWALAPRGLRLRLARSLVARTGGPQSGGAWSRIARRLEKSAGGGAQCHDCDAHPARPAARSRSPE